MDASILSSIISFLNVLMTCGVHFFPFYFYVCIVEILYSTPRKGQDITFHRIPLDVMQFQGI